MITLILSTIFTFIISSEVFAKSYSQTVIKERPRICFAGQCPNPKMNFCFCK